jgi:hypothetical protein
LFCSSLFLFNYPLQPLYYLPRPPLLPEERLPLPLPPPEERLLPLLLLPLLNELLRDELELDGAE